MGEEDTGRAAVRLGGLGNIIVPFGLLNAPNNHPLSQTECQECIQRETKGAASQTQGDQKLLLLTASCPFPLVPPSISLSLLQSHLHPPPFFPPRGSVTPRQKVCVHVLLCTSRMLLPSGGFPSAPEHLVWNRPQEGIAPPPLQPPTLVDRGFWQPLTLGLLFNVCVHILYNVKTRI